MIPRIRIAHLPTLVELLPRLSTALQGPRLLVKRDDQTGLALGGNKVRKLEFLLAEALANGARTLVTVGAAQSNHCRQTAALAARAGLDCVLVLGGSPPDRSTGNLLLDEYFGAELVWSGALKRDTVLQQVFQDAWSAGRRPYLIPLGGSTPVGAAGYMLAMQEYIAQAAERADLRADWIVLASSSGGTQAGLLAGARQAGWPGRILGISIDRPAPELQEIVAGLAQAAADLFGKPGSFSPGEVLVNDQFLGAGYGVVGPPEQEAIRLFARQEGLLLDPVYTGRAAAGMISLIRTGFFNPSESVLFWHTGGTPAVFADQYHP
jgi:D-cysteine desulfhydrase family pyridoxal phosphate-dependent enzyme